MKKKILIPLGLVILCTAATVYWDYLNKWSYAGKLFSHLAKNESGDARTDSNQLCNAHGYPESGCFRCNPSAELQKKFAAGFDWCKEHGLPETQCEICDPFARFKAKGDWCAEHEAPESQCAQCNPSVVSASEERSRQSLQISVERIDQAPNSNTPTLQHSSTPALQPQTGASTGSRRANAIDATRSSKRNSKRPRTGAEGTRCRSPNARNAISMWKPR